MKGLVVFMSLKISKDQVKFYLKWAVILAGWVAAGAQFLLNTL